MNLIEESVESFPECFPEKKIPRKVGTHGWFSTESQQAGLRRLHRLADLFGRIGNSSTGAFRPLLRCLIIGATGTGKSTLAREFAAQRNWTFTSVDCGSWLIQGAYSKPATLLVIRDHVRSADRTCLYLDEACKMFPGGMDSRSGWYLSVFAEWIALIDGDERLLNHEWTREDIRKYKESCYVVCGGAFADAMAEAKRCSQRGSLGYRPGISAAATHSSKIREALPGEIFTRFHPEHILLAGPTRQDYARGIEMIHDELGVERTIPLQELLDEAEASESGVRWLTGYLTKLLLENPETLLTRHVPESKPKAHSLDFFTPNAHHYARETTTYAFELRGVLARLYADLGRCRPLIARSRDKALYHYLYGLTGDRLAAKLTMALRVLSACDDIGSDDSEVITPLSDWHEEALVGLREFPGGLSRHGLLPCMTKSWDLATRVCELRNKISSRIAAGRLTGQ